MEYLTEEGFKQITEYFKANPAVTAVPTKRFLNAVTSTFSFTDLTYILPNSNVFKSPKTINQIDAKFLMQLDLPGKIWRLHHQDYIEQKQIQLEQEKIQLEKQKIQLEEQNHKYLIAALNKLNKTHEI